MFGRAYRASPFPTYLLPSVPFRRRQTSTDSALSTESATTTTSSDPPSPSFPAADRYLTGNTSHLRCAKCATDICLTSQVISKGFTGRHGRAYLVSPTSSFSTVATDSLGMSSSLSPVPALPNTRTDAPSQRQLVTGTHTVSDVRCAICHSMLGWKYDGAEEESQRYKVGKYILETKMVCASSDWEHETVETMDSAVTSTTQPPVTAAGMTSKASGIPLTEDTVEFDSQDEDECEDLFAGVWSPALAIKRRQNKMFRKTVVTEVDFR